jgi:hypothetical protein
MSRIPQLYNFHLNIVLKQGGNFRLLVFSFFEEDRTCIVGHFICRAPLPNGKDILFFFAGKIFNICTVPLTKIERVMKKQLCMEFGSANVMTTYICIIAFRKAKHSN